mmetsp:Transcript_6864/g.10851  ORF Transcript_6864/g.10851 Transcript_6864/m.10851 type:complete len:429 (-) Transcript_6864:197-1483(-)
MYARRKSSASIVPVQVGTETNALHLDKDLGSGAEDPPLFSKFSPPSFMEDAKHEIFHEAFVVPTALVAAPLFFGNVHFCDNLLQQVWAHDRMMALMCASTVWLMLAWTLNHFAIACKDIGKFFSCVLCASIPLAVCLCISYFAKSKVGLFVFLGTFISTMIYWCMVFHLKSDQGRLSMKVIIVAVKLAILTDITLALGCLLTGLPQVIVDPYEQFAVFGVAFPLGRSIYLKFGVKRLSHDISTICKYEGNDRIQFTNLFDWVSNLSSSAQTFISVFLIENDGAFTVSILTSCMMGSAPYFFLLSRISNEKERRDLEVEMVTDEVGEGVALILGGLIAYSAYIGRIPLHELLYRSLISLAVEMFQNYFKKRVSKYFAVFPSNVNIRPSVYLFITLAFIGQSCYYFAWIGMWMFMPSMTPMGNMTNMTMP